MWSHGDAKCSCYCPTHDGTTDKASKYASCNPGRILQTCSLSATAGLHHLRLARSFQDNILNILTELVFFIPSHIVLTDGEDYMDTDSFLAKYSALVLSINLCFVERWICAGRSVRTRTAKPDKAVPSTATAGLLACDRQTALKAILE